VDAKGAAANELQMCTMMKAGAGRELRVRFGLGESRSQRENSLTKPEWTRSRSKDLGGQVGTHQRDLRFIVRIELKE